MNTIGKTLIISNDFVFNELMASMITQFSKNNDINKVSSYNELRELNDLEETDLILLSDMVEGARGIEILEYLRYNKKIVCPIGFFCENIPDLRMKVLKRGANYCFTRPFKPDILVLDILKKANVEIK